MASQVRLSHCNMGSGLRGDQVWELGIEHYPAIIRSASSRKITDIGSGLNPTTYTWNCEEKGLRCMVKSRRSVKIRVTGRSSSESSQVILAQIRLWRTPRTCTPGLDTRLSCVDTVILQNSKHSGHFALSSFRTIVYNNCFISQEDCFCWSLGQSMCKIWLRMDFNILQDLRGSRLK